jgi:hypothetical protein
MTPLPYQSLLLEFLTDWLAGPPPLPPSAAFAAAEHFLDGAIAGASMAGEDARQASVHYCVSSYVSAAAVVRALPPGDPPQSVLVRLRDFRACLYELQRGAVPPPGAVEQTLQFFEQLGRAAPPPVASDDDYE